MFQIKKLTIIFSFMDNASHARPILLIIVHLELPALEEITHLENPLDMLKEKG